jgi:hypothetical protein
MAGASNASQSAADPVIPEEATQITDAMMEAARHAFHGAVERQVPDAWSYWVRFDGAMFAALEAALRERERDLQDAAMRAGVAKLQAQIRAASGER